MAKRSKWDGMIPLPVVALGVYFVILAVALVLSIMVFKFDIVIVGALVVLETLMAALLGKVPSWLHAAIFIGQIGIGMMAGKSVMITIMAVLYVAAAALLYVWRIDFGRK